MKTFQDIFHANKDSKLMLKPMKNLIQSKKCLNYILKKNKLGLDFKDNIKVYYEAL